MYDSAKRIFDIVTSVTLFFAMIPLFASISLAILLERKGPVLFSQTRIGRHGIPFTIIKFRTLPLSKHDVSNPLSIATPLGRFLRRWGLDELPQLWNVLAGEMSIVGPRPTLPEQVAQYSARERKRLDVRPGITGWAQIHGRNAIDWSARIKLDIEYVRDASLLLDLLIFLRTPFALLSGSGTYGPGGKNYSFEAASRNSS